MAKTAAEWEARPKFPETHYVDSRIYTDEAIFDEEQEKLFKPELDHRLPRVGDARRRSTTGSSPIPPACR